DRLRRTLSALDTSPIAVAGSALRCDIAQRPARIDILPISVPTVVKRLMRSSLAHNGGAATAPQKFSPREVDVTKPSAMMAAAIAAAAALISMPSAQAAGTVKIGILWPLTGNAAAAGQASKAAAEIAAEIVNNKHAELGNLPLAATEGLPNLGGAKLELVFVDHQGNPSLAQQLATRLITQDKVNALMGAYQSSCTFTATPVAERYGTPFMVGDSAALNITTRGFKHVFRATPIATDYART